MTETSNPTNLTKSRSGRFFSSGPLRQAPRMVARPPELTNAVTGRSHRSKSRQGPPQSGDRQDSCGVLGVPVRLPHWHCARHPTPGPSKWRCGQCSGPRPVTVAAWESFGQGWVTDAVKQLKLDPVVLSAEYGAASRPRRRSIPSHDVVFTWNGTTSGVSGWPTRTG